MQQAQPNLQWQHPPMNAATIQQSWTYGQAIPSIVPQQVPTPVARKQVPSRKPVGQAVSPQETVAPQNSKSTSRQSVSSISSLPSLSGSVTSPINRGVPTQPTFQSPPPIIKQLPVGWIICNDANGRTYFFNTITNHSSWEPPESEIITPNYGFPPTFTPVTYAHVPVPQSLPISQPTIQSTDAFSHMNIAPHLSQMPTPITPQQQQISPTTTFPSQSPSTFTTQPQSISPTNSFSSQSRPFSQPVDLQWETYPADHQPSRRKSRFSMPKGFTAPKIDTASVRNGAKIAGQTSMKGAKIAGKALKNNRKVIGAGVKIANAVLKETTGVTIPGAGLIAGDSDNDDDGVLGAVGAIGSMIGGGTGNDCDVYVEVDEISIDNDGTVEVECEEADIYQDQGSLEGLGSLHHQEQIIRAAVMSQVQQSAKQPHNRRKQLANDPQRQGQAISNQGSEVAAPARGQNLQSSNGSTSGRKPLQTSKIQQPTISTRQFQPDESQTQENSKSRPTKAAGATENMQATLQEVSNLAKGFSGIFRDVEVEGSSNECGENYDKTQDSVACEERNEQYSIEAVDFAEQIHGGIAMESTEAIYSEDICSNGACEVDYSTLDGSVAFCGEQGSFTINEVEHTATKRVAYSENTQSSEIVHQKSYTVETVEITDSYQQETNFEKVNLIQETQVSEASDQETTTDVYAIKNLEPAATFGEGEEERGINSQEESSSAFQNTAQNNFDSWNSNSLLEQSPWAQENAMLQENVWATEPANLPSTQETDVWAKSPQQSTSQHASYSETIFAEETVVRQETILSDTVTYTESNAIISQDFPYNENNCTEFTIIESSIIQENAQQQYTTNKAIFAEQTAAHDSVHEAMATQSTSFEVTNATMDGPFQEKKSDGETETNADTAVVETGQEETVTIHNSGFCHTRFVESDMVQELPEQATQNVIIPDENGSPPKTVVNTKMTTMMANNTSTSGNFQQRVYSQQNGQGQAFCIERDVVAPRGAQFSLQVEPYDSGAATFIETEIITLEIDHGQTQKTGSDTKTVSTQKEAMRGGDFVIETESYIETNSVVTNAVQEPSQERSVAKDEHPENHFIIHDTRHAETKLVMEATVPLVVNGKVVGVQTRSIEENMSAIPPLTLQQMNQTAPFNIEAISIVLTPPEETAQIQSFAIDDQTYTEQDVAQYVAAHEPTDKVQCSSATPQDEKFSKDAVQQRSKPPQAFAIFAGSNNTLDASEPATPRSFHEEFLMAERNACPTPEEEHPYSSIVQSKQQDEFELFFDVRPRPPTQVREIHAEDRALKDTHVTEQLRVFLERQALIFQSAANKEGVDPEYRHLPMITGVEPVAGISIPPPPPYPPPLRHRTPAQCAKPNARGILPYPDHPSSSPERALNPSKSPGTLPYPERPSYSPEPPSQPATSPTSPPSPAQQRPREQPPTKPPHSWTIPPAPLALALKPPTPRPESLATILHEAIATSQVQAPTTPPATHLSTTPNQSTSPTAQTYHELPTLQDAREEPNIIAMSAAEQYATAMFASGEFLGDDLGCRGHVEEEENVLPEVVMINV